MHTMFPFSVPDDAPFVPRGAFRYAHHNTVEIFWAVRMSHAMNLSKQLSQIGQLIVEIIFLLSKLKKNRATAKLRPTAL
jgi:hypothetical protein